MTAKKVVPGTKVALSDLVDMAPLDAMAVVAQGLMTSAEAKERIQGATLQLKVEGLRQPESKDVMSPFVRDLIAFVAMMVNKSGLPAGKLIEKMTEKCAGCQRLTSPVFRDGEKTQ